MMTNEPRRRDHRHFLFSCALGLAVGGLALAGGRPGTALFSVVLLAGFGAVLAYSPTEWATVQSPTADERGTKINEQAMVVAYLAVVVVAVIGFGVEMYRGTAGPFTLICAVGGATHGGSIAFLRRRM